MKIHILSNSLRMNSGFSNVSRYIANGLTKLGHEITMTGMQTAYLPDYNYGIKCLPIDAIYVDEFTQLTFNLRDTKADVLFCVFQADADLNMFTKAFPKTIWYPPVEGRNIPIEMVNDLIQVKNNGGTIVAQCKYGHSEMKLSGIDVPYIYHGYNDKIFKHLNFRDRSPKKEDISYCYYLTEVGKAESDPVLLHRQGCYDCKLNNREQTRCPYFREEEIAILQFIDRKWGEKRIKITDLPSEFSRYYIYGFIGQNFGIRKRIERLLKAYSILIKDSRMFKDRTLLHLHSMPITIKGINLIKIIQDLGIQDNVIFSYGAFRSSSWSEEAMNILYNTFDINVSASSSEGFCLPVLEGMACGIPMIAPNCSSFKELIEEDPNTRRGLLASIIDWQMLQDGSQRALVNEMDLANQMKTIYQSEELRKTFSKNAIKFAQDYTWEKIVKQWDRLLKTIK